MPQVDFAKVKAQVSMPQLLDHYRIQLKRTNGTAYRGKCPLPSHSSKESDNSFTVSLKEGKWIWNCRSDSCEHDRGRVSGNILGFVQAMEGCSLKEAAERIRDWYNLDAWRENGNGHRPPKTESPPKVEAKPEPKPETTPEAKPTPTAMAGKKQGNSTIGGDAATRKRYNAKHPRGSKRGGKKVLRPRPQH